MPDQLGRLTESDIKLVKDWMRQHWSEILGCAICGHSPLTIGKYTFACSVMAGGGEMIGRTAVPFVSVFCDNCGHTQLFSAVKIGLFEEKE